MENFTINDEFLCLLEKSKADEKSMNRCMRDFFKRMVGKSILITSIQTCQFSIIKVERYTVSTHLLRGICYDIDADFDTDGYFGFCKKDSAYFNLNGNYEIREITEDEWQYIENLYNQLTGFKQGFLETLNIKTK